MKNTNTNQEPLNFTSVEVVPQSKVSALFTTNSAEVFREDEEILPVRLSDGLEYMPWGADNKMPFEILNLIEDDETLSTCQMFNAEVCYGGGLKYNTDNCAASVKSAVEEFILDNDLAEYFLGVCQDFKHFGFAISVIILSNDGRKIVRLYRKEACYCRFSPIDKSGHIRKVIYGNWRKDPARARDVEVIELLDIHSPWQDLQERTGRVSSKESHRRERKFAFLSRVPTPDSTYYPIPYYASLFKGKWYNIKKFIGIAKEAKLKNSAPIKYHVEISNKYWENCFKAEHITDRKKQQEYVNKKKLEIINFLTNVDNSGKAWFSTFYITPDKQTQHEVVINIIDTDKQGGDWETDIVEAINMFCFTMRVHSNLVGSVPGKSQTNNSGSDKRELYTIAQALQKPYHDLLFTLHRIIIKFNTWEKAFPECPFIQLTTLDEHQDAKEVMIEENNRSNEESDNKPSKSKDNENKH